MKDHYSEFFCTPKYNKSGRYINFITIQGQSKLVLIIPESKHKGGEILLTNLQGSSMNQQKS